MTNAQIAAAVAGQADTLQGLLTAYNTRAAVLHDNYTSGFPSSGEAAAIDGLGVYAERLLAFSEWLGAAQAAFGTGNDIPAPPSWD